jgi:hypothetical protein
MSKQLFSTAVITTVTILFFSKTPVSASFLAAGNQADGQHTQSISVCYVQRSDGTVKDLTKLCGLRKPSSCNQNLGSAERNKVLSEFCQRNERCELKGTCSTTTPAPYGPPPGTAAG